MSSSTRGCVLLSAPPKSPRLTRNLENQPAAFPDDLVCQQPNRLRCTRRPRTSRRSTRRSSITQGPKWLVQAFALTPTSLSQGCLDLQHLPARRAKPSVVPVRGSSSHLLQSLRRPGLSALFAGARSLNLVLCLQRELKKCVREKCQGGLPCLGVEDPQDDLPYLIQTFEEQEKKAKAAAKADWKEHQFNVQEVIDKTAPKLKALKGVQDELNNELKKQKDDEKTKQEGEALDREAAQLERESKALADKRAALNFESERERLLVSPCSALCVGVGILADETLCRAGGRLAWLPPSARSRSWSCRSSSTRGRAPCESAGSWCVVNQQLLWTAC